MQSTNAVFMVQPAAFQYNAATAGNNKFQNKKEISALKEKVQEEFHLLVHRLQQEGVDVNVIADTEQPVKPDAVFPNNWVSFNADGSVFIYPMYAPNRRTEKRPDSIDTIKEKFQINSIQDFSYFENRNMFLESTGSIVFDHINKIGYAVISERTNPIVLKLILKKMGYCSISFRALDNNQFPIYHTNVMLTIGTGYAIICLVAITDPIEKQKVVQSFNACNLMLIDITLQQVSNFCGNMLELENKKGEKILLLSQRAFNSLVEQQKSAIEKKAKLIPVNIETIEIVGGGGVRCMLAEIFTPKIK
jgi:hypothetical protein